MMDVKALYVTVHSQQFSPCGKFLAAGNQFGKISLFNLDKMLQQTSNTNGKEANSPYAHFTLENGENVYSLKTFRKDLVVGSSRGVYGYSWDKLKESSAAGNSLEAEWSIQIPIKGDLLESPAVDCIEAFGAERLVLGCRDNNVHIADVEHGRIASSLTGHDNFIHSISVCGNQLASASEDGTVRLWDLRSGKQAHKLIPSSHDKLNRRKLGKWVGAVALNEDWLVCGGGPRLCLWHLKSLTPSRVLLEESEAAIHVIQFHEDSIIAAGQEPIVHKLLFSGESVVNLPSSSPRIYSVATSDSDQKLLTIAGSSRHIDVCRNSMYRDRILNCQP